MRTRECIEPISPPIKSWDWVLPKKLLVPLCWPKLDGSLVQRIIVAAPYLPTCHFFRNSHAKSHVDSNICQGMVVQYTYRQESLVDVYLSCLCCAVPVQPGNSIIFNPREPYGLSAGTSEWIPVAHAAIENEWATGGSMHTPAANIYCWNFVHAICFHQNVLYH